MLFGQNPLFRYRSLSGLSNVKIQLLFGRMTKMSENAQTNSTIDGFYVQPGCCTSCGVPQSVAPDLVGWTNESHPQCYWIKQPANANELNQAINLFRTQELGCHRYSGHDPTVLQKLPAEDCDHYRPDLRLKRDPNFSSFGPSPTFTLSVSKEHNIFSKAWRRLLGK